jgi:hypothetical protein
LNRSRKHRLEKRGEKREEKREEEEGGGETEMEGIGRKESVLAEEEKGDTGGLKVSGKRGDSDDEEEAQ